MCTLSIIPLTGSLGRRLGYRAMINRDELDTRPAAAPPSIRTIDNQAVCWPTDPRGGGTWLSSSQSGLTLALLNVNLGAHEPHTDGARSRGEIIPALAAGSSATAAAADLRHMDLSRYRPFRLVAIDRERVMDLRWDRCILSETMRPLIPSCFVSSGLGDHVVEPRLMLFDATFSAATATPQMQDTFHQHVWPNHERLSVMMSREDARTKSVTTVEARWDEAELASVQMHHAEDAGLTSVDLSGLVAAAC